MPSEALDEKAIFNVARQIGSPDARADYLHQACGSDSGLRERVEVLLRAYEEQASFLESPPVGVAPTTDQPASESPGTVIGPYKLVEPIGEGGMGAVWMAQQTEPVKRLVALKLIKPGMDSRQVIARFEAERQALALMDHPNIARVLDGGTTPSGRPYFVMDLVKGVPITKYSDEHRLTPRERLELFVPVCQAVQHAHQKGVIHRDLKPSNVLVALYDGKPVPKVIDFGVAKAAGPSLTDKTLVTGFGAIVGTPEYMSPEQAEVNQLDIDTRSDIYSLGVLLYELLTGGPPFSRNELEKAGLLEMLRVIREQEPSRPSTKLSTAESLPTLAANRGTEPAKLTRLVRGELDWIVMKALEKDRGCRYETANGFAADVQRYLADEPVQAGPPSGIYRLRKFVRRNKGPVLAASLVALALVAGVVGTTLGLVQARERAEGEQRAKNTAEKRLAQIERGVDILGLMFADLDPYAEEKEGRPLRAILGDRLDRVAADLEGEALGDPLVVARLRDRLGETYLGLGRTDTAEALFAKSAAIRQAELGADDPLTLASRHNLALAHYIGGKPNEGINLLKQVHADRVRVLGIDHPGTLTSLHYLGAACFHGGHEKEAVRLLEQARDGRVKQLGEYHDHTLQTLEKLALAYVADGKHAEAIKLAEHVRNTQQTRYGEGHPRAIEALYSLATTYQASYKMKPALELLEQAQQLAVPNLGPEHPLTLRIQQSLGNLYRAYQNAAKAIDLLEHVRERRILLLGGQHPLTLNTLLQLGLAYQDAGNLDKALALLQQAAIGVERLQFARSTEDATIPQLIFLHERRGENGQAEIWRRKWLAVIKEREGPESGLYAGLRGLAGLGWNLLKQQRYAEAEPILRESLAILGKIEPGEWATCFTETLLGRALLGQQKYAEAEPLLVAGYEGMKRKEKGLGHGSLGSRDSAKVIETLERLVHLYEKMNNPVEAAKWREKLETFKNEMEARKKPKGK